MTQRWVGRAAVALAFGLALAGVQPVSTFSGTTGIGTAGTAGPMTVRLAATRGWEIGTLAFPGDDPRVLLYVAQRVGSGWETAVEGSTAFEALAARGSAALAGTMAGDLLATTTVRAAASDSAALSLPWTDGKVWRLTGGPHNNYGKRKHPWSSLDFAGPEAGVSSKVRAARGGIVLRPCANLVQIRHRGGWTTSYYHLKKINVRAGQRVKRGALLGYTSKSAGCGGYATGPHVHFAVLRNGSHVNLDGLAIGGWIVREGRGQYYGCLVRDGSNRCAPGGKIHNNGAIGSG